MRRVVLCLLVCASLAVPAAAAEPFVALVDLERSLLLIPEGTVVPQGVEFYLEPETVSPRAALSIDAAIEEEAAPRRFVFAYAPAARFVEARKRIEQAEATLKADDAGLMSVANMDQMFYYYFDDGSWHGVRKVIRNLGAAYNYNVSFSVQTFAQTSSGDFDSKITVSQWGTYASGPWSQSNTCFFYGYPGTCNTPVFGVQTPNGNWTGSASSRATITHYFYPPCDLPCKENLSSTVVVNFP